MQVLVGGHSFVRRFRDDMTKRQMTLDTDNVSVTMIAQGGAYCAGPRSLMTKINDCYTDKHFPLLILELGSNDIDKGRRLSDVVDTYVHEVELLCRTHSAHAVLCLPIPRSETKFPGSGGKTLQFNNLLKLKVLDKPQITTWKHKGLFKASGKTMDKDGIHLNGCGNNKYFYSIKSAIGMYSGRLNGGNFK